MRFSSILTRNDLVKKSSKSFIAVTRRVILFIGVVLCTVGFGFISWQAGASDNRSGISPDTGGGQAGLLKLPKFDENRERDSNDADSTRKIEGNKIEDDSQLDESARDSPPDTT